MERVKPAVISVRVRVESPKVSMQSSPFQQGSPMERFFRRFGILQRDRPTFGCAAAGGVIEFQSADDVLPRRTEY